MRLMAYVDQDFELAEPVGGGKYAVEVTGLFIDGYRLGGPDLSGVTIVIRIEDGGLCAKAYWPEGADFWAPRAVEFASAPGQVFSTTPDHTDVYGYIDWKNEKE